MSSPMRAMLLQAAYEMPPTGLGALSKTQFDKLPGPQQAALVAFSHTAGQRNIDIEANEGAIVTVNGNVVKIDTTGLDVVALDAAALEAGFTGSGGMYTFPANAQTTSVEKKSSMWAWLLGAAAVGGVAYVATQRDGSSRSNPARAPSKKLLSRQLKFVYAMSDLLLELGATPQPVTSQYMPERFDIETIYGPLEVTLYGDWVPARFKYPERAAAGLNHLYQRVNPFSGKWNHHYGDKVLLADAVADMRRELRSVLP